MGNTRRIKLLKVGPVVHTAKQGRLNVQTLPLNNDTLEQPISAHQ